MSIRARGGLIIECIFVSTGGWPETRGWSGGGGGGRTNGSLRFCAAATSE